MGGQAHPTFHPTLVFSMLDEILDAFDQGLRNHNNLITISINFHFWLVDESPNYVSIREMSF